MKESGPPAPELDAFLFAIVGSDRSGMPLTLASVLARGDLDPWDEAARLADLPRSVAARQLASFLTGRVAEEAPLGNPGALVRRLVELLPKGMPPPVAEAPDPEAPPPARRKPNIAWLVILALLVLALFALGPRPAWPLAPGDAGSIDVESTSRHVGILLALAVRRADGRERSRPHPNGGRRALPSMPWSIINVMVGACRGMHEYRQEVAMRDQSIPRVR